MAPSFLSHTLRAKSSLNNDETGQRAVKNNTHAVTTAINYSLPAKFNRNSESLNRANLLKNSRNRSILGSLFRQNIAASRAIVGNDSVVNGITGDNNIDVQFTDSHLPSQPQPKSAHDHVDSPLHDWISVDFYVTVKPSATTARSRKLSVQLVDTVGTNNANYKSQQATLKSTHQNADNIPNKTSKNSADDMDSINDDSAKLQVVAKCMGKYRILRNNGSYDIVDVMNFQMAPPPDHRWEQVNVIGSVIRDSDSDSKGNKAEGHDSLYPKLTVEIGAMVLVKMQACGWLKAFYRGRETYVPCKCIKQIPLESIIGSSVVALYDYIPKNEDELRLRKGELIRILTVNKEEPGWWTGYGINIGTGLFPDNYVEILNVDGQCQRHQIENTTLNKQLGQSLPRLALHSSVKTHQKCNLTGPMLLSSLKKQYSCRGNEAIRPSSPLAGGEDTEICNAFLAYPSPIKPSFCCNKDHHSYQCKLAYQQCNGKNYVKQNPRCDGHHFCNINDYKSDSISESSISAVVSPYSRSERSRSIATTPNLRRQDYNDCNCSHYNDNNGNLMRSSCHQNITAYASSDRHCAEYDKLNYDDYDHRLNDALSYATASSNAVVSKPLHHCRADCVSSRSYVKTLSEDNESQHDRNDRYTRRRYLSCSLSTAATTLLPSQPNNAAASQRRENKNVSCFHTVADIYAYNKKQCSNHQEQQCCSENGHNCQTYSLHSSHNDHCSMSDFHRSLNGGGDLKDNCNVLSFTDVGDDRIGCCSPDGKCSTYNTLNKSTFTRNDNNSNTIKSSSSNINGFVEQLSCSKRSLIPTSPVPQPSLVSPSIVRSDIHGLRNKDVNGNSCICSVFTNGDAKPIITDSYRYSLGSTMKVVDNTQRVENGDTYNNHYTLSSDKTHHADTINGFSDIYSTHRSKYNDALCTDRNQIDLATSTNLDYCVRVPIMYLSMLESNVNNMINIVNTSNQHFSQLLTKLVEDLEKEKEARLVHQSELHQLRILFNSISKQSSEMQQRL
ncbi:hypothetical protein GJ496_001764 [Pomphorhynchus laevis]|nr:hypothetical protein GJ496_001764 [Pomphorhynchus laevis]